MRKAERTMLRAILHDLQCRVAKISGTVEYLAEFIGDDADASQEEAGVVGPRGTEHARLLDTTPPCSQPRSDTHPDQTVMAWCQEETRRVLAAHREQPSPSTEVDSLEALVIEAHEDRRLRSEPGDSLG
jgi:hypothetical protein